MKIRNASLGLGLGLLAACGSDGTIDPGLSGGTGGTGSAGDPTGGTAPATTTVDPSAGEGTSDSAGSTGGETVDPSAGDTTGGESSGEESGGSTGDPPECTQHTDCTPGTMCEDGTCVAGCTGGSLCPDGEDCCGGTCVDLQTDIDHCMACDFDCPTPPNIEASCESGVCQLGECDDGWEDCDGQGATGCESSEACLCNPGEMEPCYPGPAGTADVGICASGTRTCNDDGTSWSACVGFTLPEAEQCGDGLDNDCDTFVDGNDPDLADIDGDGWAVCEGDCCETTFECSDPLLVNPGAFEYIGNLVDDDCDPATSDAVAPADCSVSEDLTNLTGRQLAEAMDLCQFTTANPPLENRIWGVISAEIVLPDGTAPGATQLGDMRNIQAAVLEDYGNVIAPGVGPTMAGLSTGWMRDEGHASYEDVSPGTAVGPDSVLVCCPLATVPLGWSGDPPASYVNAHGGALPSSVGCDDEACPVGEGANDGISLRLTIRVPTNAQSFRYRLRYFTAEYWNYQCTAFNDFFLALLDTGAAGIPPDGNISFDSLDNPISVNNGFFEVCEAPGFSQTCNTCPDGLADLAGTGMQNAACGGLAGPSCDGAAGGGTVWLETTAPVEPGETMVLELMVFDVSDGVLDSLVVLDGFEWDIDPSDVGTEPQ
jgi:hypothetical protein